MTSRLDRSCSVFATEDGNWIARCSRTGITVSAGSMMDAVAELRRLLAHRQADAREGAAA